MEALKAGIYRQQKIIKAGYKSFGATERPVFTIMNTTRVTIIFPRWYRRLWSLKKLEMRTVEFASRELQEKIQKNDLLLGSYSLYDNPHIIVRSAFDGHPTDARESLKAQLRLFNIAMKEFFAYFRPLIETNLIEYKITNNKIIYCPVGPRKGLSPS